MSKESTRTKFLTGDFISENAVRRVLGRRRRAARTTHTESVHGQSAKAQSATAHRSSPAGGSAPLRRWSVAELIARAVTAAPADNLGRG